VTQDTVIGLASSAPAAMVGLTLATLATTAAYGGPVIVLCAVPMLVIANAYRQLNLWNANCGASFEWVGRVSAAPRSPMPVMPITCYAFRSP